MSYDLLVQLARGSLPAVIAWRDAIRSQGFAVDMDADFDPMVDSGFVPCLVGGRPSGFEYLLIEVDERERRESRLAPGHDAFIQFSVGEDRDELRAALAAAATLAAIAPGVLVDPQRDEQCAGGKALDWARANYP